MAWYFQASPHDTHDWDAVQTPVCSTARSTASRVNCWRRRAATATSSCSTGRTGKNIVTQPLHRFNWAKGMDAEASRFPIRKGAETGRRAGDAQCGRWNQLVCAEF